jgi:hypothetical protein
LLPNTDAIWKIARLTWTPDASFSILCCWPICCADYKTGILPQIGHLMMRSFQ